MAVGDYLFQQTCWGCPEAYDVDDLHGHTAYVRLRWGSLTCECPDVGGELVYSHTFDNEMKGIWESYEEEQKYLRLCEEAIQKYWDEHPLPEDLEGDDYND